MVKNVLRKCFLVCTDFCNFAPVKRIGWIDWAKCLAVMTVVFCHLPQAGEAMYFRYLQACIISVFFFLSGYLKRDRGSMVENWRKYTWGLVVPYVVYNLLMLPYWVVRYCVQQGCWPDGAALAKPLVGALLMEHTSSYAEPLNGTLWYLPAILLMHLLTDLCHRTRYEHRLMVGLCVASVAGHYLYRLYEPHPSLPVMGFIRRLPYFYMGYVAGQLRWLRGADTQRRQPWLWLLLCAGCLVGSVVLFRWHVATVPDLALHLAIFYPVNVLFVLAVVCGCRLLDGWTPQWVANVSIGTLVVIGLQWMVIGTTNYAVGLLTATGGAIVYAWHEALLLTLLVTALHYPVILLAKRYAPVLLGQKLMKSKVTSCS